MFAGTGPKTYESILKTLLVIKKIPYIPLLFCENKFIADLIENAELFNTLFAN